MNLWDSYSRMRDVKLMALTSWWTHDEVRAEGTKKVMPMENYEPLYIRE